MSDLPPPVSFHHASSRCPRGTLGPRGKGQQGGCTVVMGGVLLLLLVQQPCVSRDRLPALLLFPDEQT